MINYIKFKKISYIEMIKIKKDSIKNKNYIFYKIEYIEFI